MSKARFLIDVSQSPRVIHDLSKIVTYEDRKQCKIREIKRLNNDRYLPADKDTPETVEYYVMHSPVSGQYYIRCVFCSSK